MANLRSLIAYADDSTFRSFVGLTTNYGSQYRQIRMYNFCTNDPSWGANIGNYDWRAPQGTNFIKFEIWGGGGSGANSCCCMFGYPGGAGAYAFRTLCAKDLGDLSGCPFEICIGHGACCIATGSAPTVGYYGCKSYVTGVGLCNFCAEGGSPGIGFCALSFMCCFCYNGQGEAANNGGSYDIARRGENLCGPHPANCGHSCFTPGGGIGLFWRSQEMGKLRGNPYCDMFGNARRFDTCGNAVQLGHATNHCYGAMYFGTLSCASYYGADGGAFGLPGALGSPCNQDAAGWCMVVQHHPFPGGLINTRGGYQARRIEMNYAGENSQAAFMTAAMGFWGGANDGAWAPPGTGGVTASSTGGNCYCGGPGYAGMVQITYGGSGQGYV